MIHHVRAAGVSFVLDARGAAVPAIVHWGRDLGELTEEELAALADASVPAVPRSSIDVPLRVTVVPDLAEGWSGRPAVLTDPALPWRHVTTEVDGGRARSHLVAGGVRLDLRWELTPEGVLVATGEVSNLGGEAVRVGSLAIALPLADRAREVLDFTGRWSGEREPQRMRPGHGVWLRESRHGRGGHDDAFLFVAGTPSFTFRSGEVWAAHVAWSGDTTMAYERSPLGATVLTAGERLEPLLLGPGETYRTPDVVAVWSDAGLDGLSDRIHPWVRGWATARRPRPLTLNTWEAVYFDQSIERLAPLVDRAAQIGVERFVLDDGWFSGRSDDRRALGDWLVDAQKWPEGLWPLIERVGVHGMEFGLWVEPEMVSADSDLARAHPDWLLTPGDSLTWRWQHVLDLGRAEVVDHLFERLDALLTEYPIGYLKWDHNRDLLVADSRAQVLGLYRLLDRVKRAHPQVEIESCASGGARIDLGILRRVDRVWTSDTNDPGERQRIQRWTGLLIPPEHLGAHVGDERAHTTGRTSALSFRLATALFLHAGIESDVTRVSDADRDALRRWAGLYRDHRALLHGGRVVRSDTADPAVLIHGVVAADRAEALYCCAVLDRTDSALGTRMTCEGLDPHRRYRVTTLDLGAPSITPQDAPPPWYGKPLVLTGSALAEGILAMPVLAPGNAIVVHVSEVR